MNNVNQCSVQGSGGTPVDNLKLIAVAIYVFTFCAAGLLGYNSIKRVHYYWNNIGYGSKIHYNLALHAIISLIYGAIITILLLITFNSKVLVVGVEPGFGVRSYLNYSSDVFILILLLFLILFLLLADLYLNKESEIKMKICSDVMSLIQNVLNKNERMVIQELLSVQEMTQAELQRRTGIPKATLSRTLKNLESKGLIIRFRSGMSNMVRLKEPEIFH